MKISRIVVSSLATCACIISLTSTADASELERDRHSDSQASARLGAGFAFVSFKAPKKKSLRVRKNRCAVPSPKFGWKIVTNYDSAMFSGSATVKFKGKVYGKSTHTRFSVNRDQTVTLFKSICKPGIYTMRVRGKVTSNAPIDGYNYKTFEKVSGKVTYRVKKAR